MIDRIEPFRGRQMKKLFVFAVVIFAAGLIPLKADGTQWRKNILNKINTLPMPFMSASVAQSGYTVQEPYFWQIQVKKDLYHAAILFEDYPEGMYPDSMRFLAVFMVWKNGQIHYRQVIENDPERIRITSSRLGSSSDGTIYLVLDYEFEPCHTDTFADLKSKCRIVLPITGHLHASPAEFESLTVGGLPIRNGVARADKLPLPDKSSFAEMSDYRRKNPVYQIVFPHCYVVQQEKSTFHIALVDRQHEDLLTVCIWKDRKLHSVYLLDHYEQFYSTPDRMKINSGPWTTLHTQTPAVPVWESIFLRYVINNYFGGPDSENWPSTRYYKQNYLTIKLKNSGTYDMRKQQFDKGFVYTPQLSDK